MRNVRGRAAAAALVIGAALRGSMLTAQAAQEPAAPDRGAAGRRAVALWTALARDEPLTTRLGRTHDRDLYMVGVRLARALGPGGAVHLEYTLDVIPAIVTTGNPVYAVRRSRSPRPLALTRTETVYGAGVVPLGLQLRAALGSRAALLVRTSGGAAVFAQQIPDPAGTRLNFTADIGAALELRLTQTLGASAAFRLHHLSNGGTGRVNPGMDSRMLELGIVRLRR